MSSCHLNSLHDYKYFNKCNGPYRNCPTKCNLSNDEVIFQFGAFEDADQFDPIDVYGYFANERDYELDESEIELADGLQVKRYLYYGILKDIKALVYEWELDGLTYYLTVSDKRYEELDELEQYEADYIKLMESVEEPS